MAWAAYLVWMQSMGFPTYCRPNTMTLKVNSSATVAEQLRWNTDASILMLPTCNKRTQNLLHIACPQTKCEGSQPVSDGLWAHSVWLILLALRNANLRCREAFGYSAVIIEKLAVTQLVKKFHAFCITSRLIIMFIKTR